MICGKEEMLPRVAEVSAFPEYQLILTFKNGEQKQYNAEPLLHLPMYKNLSKVFYNYIMQLCVIIIPLITR